MEPITVARAAALAMYATGITPDNARVVATTLVTVGAATRGAPAARRRQGRRRDALGRRRAAEDDAWRRARGADRPAPAPRAELRGLNKHVI